MKKSFPIGKTYIKTIGREIKNSFGRFFAIFVIVALGVGFLAGVLAATPDMKATLDKYYDNNHMSDIFIKATMGLTEQDLQKIASIGAVERIMPASVTDAFMKTSSNEVLETRIYGIPLLESTAVEKSNGVNSIELLEGRMPFAKNECLIERSGSYLSDLKLGTELTLTEDNKDYGSIGDTYNTLGYKVVGIVKNPFYISTEREPSNIGKGTLGAIIYVDRSCYSLDVFTDFYITVKGSSELTAFTDRYDNWIKPVVTDLKTMGKVQSNIRYNGIKKEAEEKLNDATKKYEDGKKKAEKKLLDALEKLQDGKRKISENTKKLADGEKQIIDGKQELAKAKQDYKIKIAESKKQVSDGELELAAGKERMAKAKLQLDAGKNDIEQAKTAIENGVQLSTETLAKIAEYDEAVKAYENGMSQITINKEALLKYRALLISGQKEAEQKFAKAEATLKKSEAEIIDGKMKLNNGRVELVNGEREYRKGKIKAEKELASAAKKIADARKKVNEIEQPKWYVLDRSSNMGYASFSMQVEKVADIAKVFPIFFFLVAALVSLTTMTRMVEEERIQIGILKALGYKKGIIMFKYLVYCGLASLLGCILGLGVGFILIPNIVYKVYSSMYHLPPFVAQINWTLGMATCGLIITSTMGATILACSQSLKEKPAYLMLARAPKAGKRILLERINFIWSRMKFSHKATARNLFRYKKHFFMTVIGISGCTALIFTGFGLNDSISSLPKKQYVELFKYDLKINMDKDKSYDNLIKAFLGDKTKVQQYMEIHSEAGYVNKGKERVSTSIYVPKDINQLNEYITLRDRKNGKKISFKSDSVLLTEKMAEVMGTKVGDSFTLENSDGKMAEFLLTGITENYLGCYAYVNPGAYSKAFGENNSFDTVLVETKIKEESEQDKAISGLLASESVISAQFNSQIQTTFNKLVKSIGYVIVLLIAAAGALAMIVLYNLTNININERSKELATLRVLGYHHEEVAAYIFREIAILSVIGTIVGLFLGIGLHSFVNIKGESIDMMFGRTLSPMSFILAAGITLLFSAVVDLMMLGKLRKIEMVESMKAVD